MVDISFYAMLGSNLTRVDEWTVSLVTNPEIIAMDQHSTGARQVISSESVIAWVSTSELPGRNYLAVFNISPSEQDIHLAWKQVGLDSKQYQVRDLWNHREVGSVKHLELKLPSHGCVVYSVAEEQSPNRA